MCDEISRLPVTIRTVLKWALPCLLTAGTAYLIEMDGMCDREHNDILIPALHTASGLEDASVSTMFGRREVQLEQPAGRVVIARWPGFASSLLRTAVADVHWKPQTALIEKDKRQPLAHGTWREPWKVADALAASDGFLAEERREKSPSSGV